MPFLAQFQPFFALLEVDENSSAYKMGHNLGIVFLVVLVAAVAYRTFKKK